MKAIVFNVVLISLLMAANQSLACGDSVYRAGSGTAYRTYSAPLPGNILVYGPDESFDHLAAQLTESGHQVRVVHTEAELKAAVVDQKFDVLISEASLAGDLQPSYAQRYIPVAANKAEARSLQSSMKGVLVRDRHQLKHYLKAIHTIIKRQP